MSKKLVTYFSASGVTKAVAEKLAQTLGSDIFEIAPKVLYTAADLDWRDKTSRSTVEMNNLSYRPEMAEGDVDISAYDTVYVGFPIWWYIAPTIINTFLEKYDWNGKKIVLFATSGGSGWGKTVEKLEDSCKGAEIVEGKIVGPTGVTAEELLNWAESL
ncbi:MAG: flavodoxin [Oscillospiraceae bacterium]|nr:flavodoxin [Oscillospiraceae bacterium]